MTNRVKIVIGCALALIGALVAVMWTLVLPQRSADLGTFANRVGSPGGATDSFSERSIVGALSYGLAQVTSGRVDDFWALIDPGEAHGNLTLHAKDGRSEGIAVNVIDLSSGQRGLAPCTAGPHCTVSTLPTGASLAVRSFRTGADAVLTDPARHLHVDVQAQSLQPILTPNEIGAIAAAPWWSTGAPRNIAAASRWLKVQHIATGFTY